MKSSVALLIAVFILLGPFQGAFAQAVEEKNALYEAGVAAYSRFSDESIDEAINLFEKVIALSPSHSRAYSALAEAYIQKYFRNSKRPDLLLEKAAAAAERALFIDARSAAAHKAIASVYYGRGKIEEAMEELERAIDMVPDYARALFSLGTCWFDLGDREMARRFFSDALQAAKDDFDRGIAYYNLASLETEERVFESALYNYRKAADLVPAYYNIHYGLGVVLMNLDRDDEAAEAFREALRLKPDYAPGQIALASAYHRLGRKKEAREAYEAALTLDPESEVAARGLAALSGRKIGCLFLY